MDQPHDDIPRERDLPWDHPDLSAEDVKAKLLEKAASYTKRPRH